MKLNISISNSNKCQTKHFDSDASEHVFPWWELSWNKQKTTLSCTAVMVKSIDSEETQTKYDPGKFFNLLALVSSLARYEY